MCVWIGMRPLGPSTLSPWHGLNGGIELGPSLSLNLACPSLSLSPLIFLGVLKSPLSLRKLPMVVAGLEHTQTYINMELSPPSTIILLPLTLFPHKSIPIPKPNWNPNLCKTQIKWNLFMQNINGYGNFVQQGQCKIMVKIFWRKIKRIVAYQRNKGLFQWNVETQQLMNKKPW